MSHFAIDQRTSRCSNEQTKVKQHKCSHGSTAWRCSRSTRTRSRFSIFALIVAFVSLVSVVAASADPTQVPAQRRQTFADLGARRVMERAAQATDGEEESSATTTIPTSSGTSSTAVASATTTTVLPQPFDTTLGNNFTTESCPRFFSTFLSDPTFRSCYPFSLLLQTSHGFFEAEKNFFQTTVALQAGCSADYDVCNNLMHSLSNQLKSASACMSDYAAENQIVMQAYRGLLAYPVMYQAACLQDEKGDYCFANAITTRSNAALADAYSYYLPLGTTIPVGNRPSCSDCLKRTMAIYRSYASNETQPLSATYVAAAQQVNMACGPNWVSDVVDSSTSSATSIRIACSVALLLPLLISTFMMVY